MKRSFVARLGVLAAATALGLSFATSASAQGGLSTPGVTVTAENPGTSAQGSTIQIALTAHSERSGVPDPSCRPEDPTLRCWGSLVLRVPSEGGFSVTGFEVHRVALEEIGCGGCGDVQVAGPDSGQPLQAQVNGVATVTDPGSLQDMGVSVGTMVQLKFTLTDAGRARYADTVSLVVNEFEPGPDKPLLFDTGPQTVQQVQVHLEGADTASAP